jgi:hypothetical protein
VKDFLEATIPMEHPEITFGEDGRVVSVWVGQFGGQESVDEYLVEQYDEDRDDEPISPFATDIGLRFYDHDLIETHHEKGLSGKEVGVFANHSYGRSFAALAWEALKRLQVIDFDTMFFLYGYAHARYPQAQRQSQRVQFVGTFPYKDMP